MLQQSRRQSGNRLQPPLAQVGIFSQRGNHALIIPDMPQHSRRQSGNRLQPPLAQVGIFSQRGNHALIIPTCPSTLGVNRVTASTTP